MENERNNLNAAKEELKYSIHAVKRDLKIYGKAKINYEKAKLISVGNNVLNAFNQLKNKAQINKLDREQKRLDREREKIVARWERLEEQARKQREKETKKMEEYKNKQQKKQERRDKQLAFKNGIKQKATSLKTKLGTVKNSVLRGLNPSNIDLKIKNAFASAGVGVLTATNFTLNGINNAKDTVTAFTTGQLEKYRQWKSEKKRQADIKKTERQYLKDIAEKEKQEQKEKDRLEREAKKNERAEKRKQNRLNLKRNTKQKATSFKSKLGTVKNSALRGLNSSNIDLKIKNAFEQAKIYGLTALNVGLEGINTIKDNAIVITATQLEKYREWKSERKRQADIRKAEKLEEEQIRSKTREHKKGMIEAFSQQEREELTNKYDERKAERDALIQSLKEQKNRLLNTKQPVTTYEPFEVVIEEPIAIHR